MGRLRHLAAVGLSLLLLMPGIAAAPGPADDADLGRVNQVLELVRENYAGEIEDGRLADDAIRGVIDQLDSHSRYLDPAAFDELCSGTSGGYEGIGATVIVRNSKALVVSVAPGGPAARAAIRAGDEIVAVNGEPVSSIDADKVGQRLRGPAGSPVDLTIVARSFSEPRPVSLNREKVCIPSVPEAFVLDGGIGYIRIDHFTERTADEFDRALEQVIAGHPRALVLDLRGNPGGVLSAAVRIAERFVPRGKLIVTTEGRHPAQDRLYFSSATGPRLTLPLAVLVDGWSASAAEVLAGALQDWDLAVIVGTRTYGKGSVQTILPLDGGGGLKLTTARYYTPSGRSIERGDDALAARGGAEAAEGAPNAAGGQASYASASGRHLPSGGGISPDVDAAGAGLPALAEELERDGYFATFAPEGRIAPAGRLERFREYVEAERGTIAASTWNESAAAISILLERDAAGIAGGQEAARRVTLRSDTVFARARGLLLSGESLAQVLHEVSPAESR